MLSDGSEWLQGKKMLDECILTTQEKKQTNNLNLCDFTAITVCDAWIRIDAVTESVLVLDNSFSPNYPLFQPASQHGFSSNSRQ